MNNGMNREQLLKERERLKEERRKKLGTNRWLHAVPDRSIPASVRFTEIAMRAAYQRRRGR